MTHAARFHRRPAEVHRTHTRTITDIEQWLSAA